MNIDFRKKHDNRYKTSIRIELTRKTKQNEDPKSTGGDSHVK